MTTAGWQQTGPSRARIDALKLAHQRIAAQTPTVTAPDPAISAPQKAEADRSEDAVLTRADYLIKVFEAAGLDPKFVVDAKQQIDPVIGTGSPASAHQQLDTLEKGVKRIARAEAAWSKQPASAEKTAAENMRKWLSGRKDIPAMSQWIQMVRAYDADLPRT